MQPAVPSRTVACRRMDLARHRSARRSPRGREPAPRRSTCGSRPPTRSRTCNMTAYAATRCAPGDCPEIPGDHTASATTSAGWKPCSKRPALPAQPAHIHGTSAGKGTVPSPSPQSLDSPTRLALPVADCPIRTGLASRENLPERLDRLIGEERMPPVVVVFYLGELPATEPPRGSAGIEYRDGPSGMDRDDAREGEKGSSLFGVGSNVLKRAVPGRACRRADRRWP